MKSTFNVAVQSVGALFAVAFVSSVCVAQNGPPAFEVEVINFPDAQTVDGTVSVDNFPDVQTVDGTVNVGNLPSTQTVDGTVNVGNLPASQTVNGTVNVGNFPAAQTVNGTVNVGNLPGNDIEPFAFSNSGGTYQVPSDKLAVIDVVSAFGTNLNRVASLFYPSITVTTNGVTTTHNVETRWLDYALGSDVQGWYVGNNMMQLYADPGSTIRTRIYFANVDSRSISVSGHLLDAPASSVAAASPITDVPEPSSAAILAGLGLLLPFRRRLRRWIS